MWDLSPKAFKMSIYVLYLFVIGFFILMISFAKLGEFEWAVTFGAIALAFIALSLGFISWRIAVDSANAIFLGVISAFEDRRIEIQHYPDWRRINVWKCLVDMRQVKELLAFCNIRFPHQNRLIDLFNKLIELLIFGLPTVIFLNLLCCEEVRHVLDMYLIASDIEDNPTREETETLIRVLLDEDDNDEINDNIISIIKSRTNDFHNEENFVLYRDEIKNYFIAES